MMNFRENQYIRPDALLSSKLLGPGAGLRDCGFGLVNVTRDVVLAEQLKLALDFRERFTGLMGTGMLPGGCGLLLAPCLSIHTCFMRYSIDAVFLDGSGKVLKVIDAMRPYRFSPVVRGARAVAELPAGQCSRTGTELGDIIMLA